MCRGRDKNWPLVSRDVYYDSSVYVIYDLCRCDTAGAVNLTRVLPVGWTRLMNDLWAERRWDEPAQWAYITTHDLLTHTHTHFKVQIKPSCVWLFSWSHRGVKAREGLRLPPPTPPLLPVFMCLYFNSSPGAASLLNTFSDIFSDHDFNAGTCGEPAIKNVHKEKRSLRSPFDEYFSSEIWVSL